MFNQAFCRRRKNIWRIEFYPRPSPSSHSTSSSSFQYRVCITWTSCQFSCPMCQICSQVRPCVDIASSLCFVHNFSRLPITLSLSSTEMKSAMPRLRMLVITLNEESSRAILTQIGSVNWVLLLSCYAVRFPLLRIWIDQVSSHFCFCITVSKGVVRFARNLCRPVRSPARSAAMKISSCTSRPCACWFPGTMGSITIKSILTLDC